MVLPGNGSITAHDANISLWNTASLVPADIETTPDDHAEHSYTDLLSLSFIPQRNVLL